MNQRENNTLLLIILFFIGFLFVSLRPIDDPDLFMQLSLGREMFRTGELITHEPFSTKHLGEAIYNPGWLGQLIFYLLYSIGGFSLIKFFHTILFVGAFTIVLKLALKETKENRSPVILLSFLLSLLVTLSNTSVRAQGIAFFCCSLVFLIVRTNSFSVVHLVFCFLIGVIWQNIHSSVLIGAGIALIEFIATRKIWLFNTACVLFIVQFFTPLGFEIIQFNQINLTISRDILHVSEWQPPWDYSVRDAMFGFWISLSAASLLLLLLRSRVELREVLYFSFFTGASLYAARFSLFWALLMLPILISWLNKALPGSLWKYQIEARRAVVFLIGVGCVLTAILLHFYFFKFDSKLPIAEVKKIVQDQSISSIDNFPPWGGLIVWYSDGRIHPYYDGRLYIYTPEEWRSFLKSKNHSLPTLIR